MPVTTREGSKSAKSEAKSATRTKSKSKKVPGKRKKDPEDYNSDTSAPKVARMDAESATEYRANLKARYDLAMEQKKHKTTSKKHYSDYQKVVKKNAQQALWKGLKFFNNEKEHIEDGAMFVFPYVMPPHFKDLKDDELEMEEAIWVQEHADIIRVAINRRRNYAKDELQKLYKTIFANEKEHEYPTPEDVEALVMRDGFNDWENDDDHEKMMVKFTNMVDYCLPKVATNHYWGEALRHTQPMLTAMSHKDRGMDPQRGVSPSDLALFKMIIENYYPQWLHDALEARYQKEHGKDPTTGKFPTYQDASGEEIKCPATRYTDSDLGVPKLGGWNKAGRKTFYKLQKRIKIAEATKDVRAAMLAIDKEALKRMRVTHKLEEKEAKKVKGKSKEQFLDKADEESDIEEDDCLKGLRG